MATPFSRTLRAAERDAEPGYIMAASGAILAIIVAAVWLVFGTADVYVSSEQARFDVADYAHPLAPQVAGTVVEVHAALGMEVAAGDALIVLDSTPQQRLLAEESARHEESARLIVTLQAQIDAQTRAREAAKSALAATTNAAHAQAAVARTTSEFSIRRQKILAKLHEKDLVAGLDSLQGEADRSITAAAAVAQQTDAVAKTRTGRANLLDRDAQIAAMQHDLAAAQGDLAISAARMAELEYEIERRHIRAPVSGVVADLATVAVGATLEAGQHLGAIVPREPVRVVAYFQSSDSVGRIRDGQEVVLRVDQYPWTQYGTLSGAVKGVGSESSDKLVRVDVDLVKTNPRIPVVHGLTGSAEIRVEQAHPYELLLRLAGQLVAKPSAPKP